ncbi:hypothetical protein BU15DRAFT_66026 [Melanogaster broomeanus]|nr:hypothetical protein BU15DRAFT_66026 [Melanogaster broomeanus]
MIEIGVKATTCGMIASIRAQPVKIIEGHRTISVQEGIEEQGWYMGGNSSNYRSQVDMRSMPRRDKSAQREMGHVRTLMEALTVERGHYVLHTFNGSTLKLEGLASKMTKKFVRFGCNATWTLIRMIEEGVNTTASNMVLTKSWVTGRAPNAKVEMLLFPITYSIVLLNDINRFVQILLFAWTVPLIRRTT